MSRKAIVVLMSVALSGAMITFSLASPSAFGQQDQLVRKAVKKVKPAYPEIARRMGINGTVKLSVVVSPNGTVKSVKVVGGHPVLVSSAEDAVKQWKFETSTQESSGIVEFNFSPEQ